MMLRRTFLAAGLLLAAFPATAQEPDSENVLVIEISGQTNGVVEIELLPQIAPLHVKRIKELARSGAYNEVAFHRVIDGFMAQTGDVKFGKREVISEGFAGSGNSDLPNVPAEFSDENFAEGVVGMARSSSPNSANSQFFIMFAEGSFLNNQYTVFGRVLSGMDIVHGIKKGAGQGGSVADPDFMSNVMIKSDQE